MTSKQHSIHSNYLASLCRVGKLTHKYLNQKVNNCELYLKYSVKLFLFSCLASFKLYFLFVLFPIPLILLHLFLLPEQDPALLSSFHYTPSVFNSTPE